MSDRPTSLRFLKGALPAVESIVLIKDNDRAKKILVAWTLYRPEFSDSPARPGESSLDVAVRLWEEVGPVDFERLALIAGVPTTKAEKTFSQLRAANLLYPDGAINEDAARIIRGEVHSHLRSLMPRTPERRPEPAKPAEPPPAAKPRKKK